MYVCMYVCLYVCMYGYIKYIYVCEVCILHAWMYVCICMRCMYVCMYTPFAMQASICFGFLILNGELAIPASC